MKKNNYSDKINLELFEFLENEIRGIQNPIDFIKTILNEKENSEDTIEELQSTIEELEKENKDLKNLLGFKVVQDEKK